MSILVTSSPSTKFQKVPPSATSNKKSVTEELSPEPAELQQSSSITLKMDLKPGSDSHLDRGRPSREPVGL